MNNIPISDKIPELDIAIKAAIEAGNEIIEIYKKDFDTFIKKDDSPITEADLRSNEIIKKSLSKTKYPILSEEDKDDQNRILEKIIWIIDPLDGTSDFIDRTGEFTVMISLIENKKPILGVISWPIKKLLFTFLLHSLFSFLFNHCFSNSQVLKKRTLFFQQLPYG